MKKIIKLLNKLSELLKFSFNLLQKIGKKLLKIVIFFLSLCIISYALGELVNPVFELINTGQVFRLGIVVITPLAITLSFSSLMYNRTRSISSKTHQFRSLYIAERLLTASASYFLLLIASFLCYQFSVRHHIIINLNSTIATNYQSLIILIPMLFLLSYIFEIYHAIFAMKFSFFSDRATKAVAIKVKKLLSSN